MKAEANDIVSVPALSNIGNGYQTKYKVHKVYELYATVIDENTGMAYDVSLALCYPSKEDEKAVDS